ncbi:hypothetical protein C8R45DRAFT_941004 [Mycena sanguinolenta]|nr:hypothetical protein C8R45DRAFT_941004 [Mycena sanguinolenta]
MFLSEIVLMFKTTEKEAKGYLDAKKDRKRTAGLEQNRTRERPTGASTRANENGSWDESAIGVGAGAEGHVVPRSLSAALRPASVTEAEDTRYAAATRTHVAGPACRLNTPARTPELSPAQTPAALHSAPSSLRARRRWIRMERKRKREKSAEMSSRIKAGDGVTVMISPRLRATSREQEARSCRLIRSFNGRFHCPRCVRDIERGRHPRSSNNGEYQNANLSNYVENSPPEPMGFTAAFLSSHPVDSSDDTSFQCSMCFDSKPARQRIPDASPTSLQRSSKIPPQIEGKRRRPGGRMTVGNETKPYELGTAQRFNFERAVNTTTPGRWFAWKISLHSLSKFLKRLICDAAKIPVGENGGDRDISEISTKAAWRRKGSLEEGQLGKEVIGIHTITTSAQDKGDTGNHKG